MPFPKFRKLNFYDKCKYTAWAETLLWPWPGPDLGTQSSNETQGPDLAISSRRIIRSRPGRACVLLPVWAENIAITTQEII